MEEFVITSFKYGLDTRKDVLTSLPGTLVTCENASINPGGEVEKRKAFVRFASLNIEDDDPGFPGVVSTFGIEVTDVGLTVFGSALIKNATITQAQPRLIDPIPAGVTYQQLKHPTLINDSLENYDSRYHRMTQVVSSENFNGKAFVIAKFIDGRTFIYFDGELVQQSANGLVLENRTALADLGNDLTRQFGYVNWEATANLDENGVTQNGAVLVKSPAQNHFTPEPEQVSTAGLFGFKVLGVDGTGTAGTAPFAQFRISTNAGTFTVTAPFNSTGTTYGDICGGAITALGTATLTAAAIASAINDLTFIHGYSATSDTDNVSVYAPVDYGPSFVYELRVAYTTGVAGAPVGSVPPLIIAKSADPLVNSSHSAVNGFIVTATEVLTPSGGGGTYTYSWTETNPGSGNGITISGGTHAERCKFLYTIPVTSVNGSYSTTGSFKCLVTPASGAPVTVTIVVNLTIIVP